MAQGRPVARQHPWSIVMSQYEARLERDLRRIHDRMEKLGNVVEAAMEHSIRAVMTGNEDLAYTTLLGDEQVNRLMREIDAMCHGFIALHLPSAGHLRTISATIRTNVQLERIGDYAVVICREAVRLSSPPVGAVARELEMVASDAKLMLHQSLRAFHEGNGEAARTTMHMADQAQVTMDKVYASLIDENQTLCAADLFAHFAIYNHLKRVFDQAKNICEETVFAVYGESKSPKVHTVLFIDEDNSFLTQMAEAIARKRFSELAVFASAGRTPASRPDPTMMAFMEEHGYDLSSAQMRRLDPAPETIKDYFVVVSLQGPAKSYLPEVPFHTSALTWDLGDPPAGSDSAETKRRCEEIYRETALQVQDLMALLTGDTSS